MKDITKLFNNPLVLFLLLITIIGASSPSVKSGKNQREFYLTNETHTADQALTACAEGFHMASLREIFDTTSVKYNTTLGATFDDSGFGPPDTYGWIRTGYVSEGQNQFPGLANCNAWTSNNPLNYGTVALPHNLWSDPPKSIIDPWDSFVLTCNLFAQVWCVQD